MNSVFEWAAVNGVKGLLVAGLHGRLARLPGSA